MSNKTKTASLITRLIAQNTSIPIVSDFLKQKGLHHSARSWDDMRLNRIIPYIESGELTLDEIQQLLRDTEEFGKQHTFLLSSSKTRAKEILSVERVEQVVKEHFHDLVDGKQIIVEKPDTALVADIRFDEVSGGQCLTVKVIEPRWHIKYVGEEIKDDLITRQWLRVYERAVNVVRLHPSGILEVRIASHSSSNYEKDIIKLFDLIGKIIPFAYFAPISLHKAKKTLLDNPEAHKDKIRFSTISLMNDFGGRVKVSTAMLSEGDLTDDEGLKASLDGMYSHNAYLDSANIWFKSNEATGTPCHDIHVLLLGDSNEFIITANCIRSDYEYVLNEIQSLNK